MDWKKLEEIITESVPNCVKLFLSLCGYDTFLSLKNMSLESIEIIENHLSSCSDAIQDLECCHSNYYKTQNEFKLLPGHRDFILSISKYEFNVFQNALRNSTADSNLNPAYPVMLQAMITTYQQNAECNKHHARYDDLMRYFSTYVYLMAGRSSYEFLKSNLPLPSTKTACRFELFEI